MSTAPRTKQPAAIPRLLEEVRNFWMTTETKFQEVWKVMDRPGKVRFAQATVSACTKMIALPGHKAVSIKQLLPEINEDRLVNDEEHAYSIFWYYNTDDGLERDEEMIQDLADMNILDGDWKTWMYCRQMALLQVLNSLIAMYNGIFKAGQSKEVQQEEKERYARQMMIEALEAQAQIELCANCKGNASNSCGKCKKVKYCGRECQVAHWKQHKKLCKAWAAQQADEKANLQKKLEAAKKRAIANSEKTLGKRT